MGHRKFQYDTKQTHYVNEEDKAKEIFVLLKLTLQREGEAHQARSSKGNVRCGETESRETWQH